MIRKTLGSILFEEDMLCVNCRRKLRVRRKTVRIEGLKVETFFEYDGLFRSLLLQYKECYDEALKDVFLFGIRDYIRIRYAGYRILTVPSTAKKREERGFDHLALMYGSLRMPFADGLKMKEEIVQEGKNRQEREAMKDNYVYEGDKLKKVLIVDDVMTTGSSLLGVYQAVKGHAERVRGLVTAYSQF